MGEGIEQVAEGFNVEPAPLPGRTYALMFTRTRE
jgi:hypothetical protein